MKGRSHHRLQNSDPPDDWVNGSWTVDCVCGVNFDDGEEMVNCDECGVWVHTRCSRYVKGDDIFVCDKCKSKNSRNNSEETEVAQLLVELPNTKTMRMESAYASNGPTCRPFRLWTDIPIEERVHIQGIPDGDPALFGGLPSVFTPELWKCTGYVPKKFNFQYREFPFWDEKEIDSQKDEENENPVDKGAGVLFSLSKESVLATPVAALVSLRGGDNDRASDRKVSLKEMKKWESDDLDFRGAQNSVKKERSLLRPAVLHSGKRKKEDIGTSKDRSSRKKARAGEKEADAKKRGTYSSRTVLTPSSDAKQLEFYEDRGLKFSKAEFQSVKNKNSRDAIVREPLSDSGLAACDNFKKHTSEAIPSEISRKDQNRDTGLNDEKVENQLPAMLTSPKTNNAVTTLTEHGTSGNIHRKDEGDKMENDKLDVKSKHPDRIVLKPPEIKDYKVQEFSSEKSLSSEQPEFKVKIECDGNSRALLNLQSSPCSDAKGPVTASDHMCENSKLNDATVSSSQSSEHKVHDADRCLEAVGDSHRDDADELSCDHCQPKQELECPENCIGAQRTSPEPRNGSELPEEHSKPGGNMLNLPAVPSQRKLGASAGKYSSSASIMSISKSSTSESFKSADTLNPNSSPKQVMPDCSVSTRKDRPSNDVKDEARDDIPRKIVKEHAKSLSDSAPKPSISGRSHDSVSKQNTLESKDSVPFLSSKTTSAPNNAVTSGSSEPSGSLHHQKGAHLHNKNSVSSIPQKGEKMNHTSFLPSSKISQNHAPSMCPPAPSSSPAALSDEELALLLHQELNSSPRVPRVPRVRHAGSLPQLASPSATSMLIKRTSSSGGKDHVLVTRRKNRDAPKDGFRNSHEFDDESKRMDRVPSSHDQKRQDVASTTDTSSKGDDDGSATAAQSVKKNMPSTSAGTANSGPSLSTEANDQNASSMRISPRNTSDEDAGTLGGPHRTLPGLISEIMSKGRRMTYEELCNAVQPHWHNLRKHNGERYAYTSHSQAVLDCLRNRHEWARLVDRGPKTNSSRKRRKLDAEELEDDDYSKGKTANQVESKNLESQREDFPKGKRKARKRRRLALQGRGIKDIRKRRKADMLTEEDIGMSSNSSEETMSSEDEIQGDGACLVGSETSASSEEAGTT